MSLTKSDELIFPIGFDQLRSQLACNGVYNVYIYRSSSFSELSSAVISLLFLLSSVNYTFTKFAKKCRSSALQNSLICPSLVFNFLTDFSGKMWKSQCYVATVRLGMIMVGREKLCCTKCAQ